MVFEAPTLVVSRPFWQAALLSYNRILDKHDKKAKRGYIARPVYEKCMCDKSPRFNEKDVLECSTYFDTSSVIYKVYRAQVENKSSARSIVMNECRRLVGDGGRNQYIKVDDQRYKRIPASPPAMSTDQN